MVNRYFCYGKKKFGDVRDFDYSSSPWEMPFGRVMLKVDPHKPIPCCFVSDKNCVTLNLVTSWQKSKEKWNDETSFFPWYNNKLLFHSLWIPQNPYIDKGERKRHAENSSSYLETFSFVAHCQVNLKSSGKNLIYSILNGALEPWVYNLWQISSTNLLCDALPNLIHQRSYENVVQKLVFLDQRDKNFIKIC